MALLKLYKWTIASAAIVLILLMLPSQVFPKAPRSPFELDKLVHAILFGAVTAIFCGEHRAWKKINPPFFLSFFIFGIFALITEASQLFTRTRHYDLLDLRADLAGIASALLIMRIIAFYGKNARGKE